MLRTFLRWNTVLSAFSIALLLYCAIALLFTYDSLNYDEGWGFVFVIALVIVGGAGLVVDLVMRQVITRRATINKAQSVILLLLFLAVTVKLLLQA
ncbi:MAG: hypothetical protein JNL52_10605 [Flavobacteriales bacterium]|nr:hypothetical protein [Flavobacteriales bacterium]